MSKQSMFGISIDNVTMNETLNFISKEIKNKSNGYIVTPNVDHIVKLQTDSEFKNVYSNASLVIADGKPLIWAGKILKKPFKEKVSGSDLFMELLPIADKQKYSVFLLGSSEKSNKKASRIIQRKYPNIKIAGRYSPPFGFEKDENENNKIISMISKASPDILGLFLGAPKQEKWIYHNYKKAKFGIALCLGASLDFISGDVKRAPVWMQKIGLEWFWRMCSDPKRLVKRYLIDDMIPFVKLMIKEVRK